MSPPFHSLSSIKSRIQSRAHKIHRKTPILRFLPFASLQIILSIALVNILIWIGAGIVLHFYPHLSSSAILAYTLGLRHALDADHISAIDLTTRRLIAAGRTDNHGVLKPVVTVGMWFSLGHSTIVIITTILVAATTASISARFDAFSSIGGIIGSSVSTAFLLLLGAVNGWLLWKGIQNLRRIVHTERASRRTTDPEQTASPIPLDEPGKQDEASQTAPLEPVAPEKTPLTTTATTDLPSQSTTTPDAELKLHNRSCLSKVLTWSLRLINRPWKIYPLGLLFGLGFDTSSEIALLGITTLESSRGFTSTDPNNAATGTGTLSPSAVWAILIFPLLFTSGMCLLDTADGALMYALYTSQGKGTSQLASAYANVLLTGFTVLVALVIGFLQFFNMLSNVLPQERMDDNPGFWDGVAAVGERYDVLGGAVCAGFVIVALVGWGGYGVWKRRFVDGGDRGGGEMQA